MSFTFSPEGIKLTQQLNNPNWCFLLEMLNAFCRHRGYSVTKDEGLCLYSDMSDDYSRTKIIKNASRLLDKEYLFKWFIKFLKSYDNITISDLDIFAIKKRIN